MTVAVTKNGNHNDNNTYDGDNYDNDEQVDDSYDRFLNVIVPFGKGAKNLTIPT